MVISGVADRVPEKVASLIYLDAFVPENGQSLLSIVRPASYYGAGIVLMMVAFSRGWTPPC